MLIRTLLIGLPVVLIGLALLAGAAYYLEPAKAEGFIRLPVLRVIHQGGTRYQAGSFPEWEVRLPNGKTTLLDAPTFRAQTPPDTICVAVARGRLTGAMHITPAPASLCAPSR